eukprot:7085312-Lingulodinium_polyedra.AAC.1
MKKARRQQRASIQGESSPSKVISWPPQSQHSYRAARRAFARHQQHSKILDLQLKLAQAEFVIKDLRE